MKVLAAGDSVLWGQGLQPQDKFHELAVRQIADHLGISEQTSEIIFKAHSGATINGPEAPFSAPSGVLWQEVPNHIPTIATQLSTPAPDPDLDLIILNGGINDINFREILLPTADDEALERKIKQHCYYDMKRLLQLARTNYPNAVITLVGYYPILSEASDLEVLQLAVTLLSLGNSPLGPLASKVVAKRSTRRMQYFHRRQLSWLRRAAGELNAERSTRGPGILFVHPAFGTWNSVGAPASFLYEPRRIHEQDWLQFIQDPLGNLPTISPADPMATERRRACEAIGPREIVDRITCIVASIGHPNKKGAERYAFRIRDKYLQNRRRSLRSHFTTLAGSNAPISVKKQIKKYGFDSRSQSLQDFLQHWIIDCIDVTITTRNADFAGTDHDVYLKLGPNRQWKLNESVFDGDLYDDFERGKTTTYGIDPAAGRLDRQLHLWELQEVSLRLVFDPEGLPTEPVMNWQPERIRVAINGRQILDRTILKELNYSDHTWTATAFPYE